MMPSTDSAVANVDRESPTCVCCSLPATRYLDGWADFPVCWSEDCERRIRLTVELL